MGTRVYPLQSVYRGLLCKQYVLKFDEAFCSSIGSKLQDIRWTAQMVDLKSVLFWSKHYKTENVVLQRIDLTMKLNCAQLGLS